jgi:hypothetical protein
MLAEIFFLRLEALRRALEHEARAGHPLSRSAPSAPPSSPSENGSARQQREDV